MQRTFFFIPEIDRIIEETKKKPSWLIWNGWNMRLNEMHVNRSWKSWIFFMLLWNSGLCQETMKMEMGDFLNMNVMLGGGSFFFVVWEFASWTLKLFRERVYLHNSMFICDFQKCYETNKKNGESRTTAPVFAKSLNHCRWIIRR